MTAAAAVEVLAPLEGSLLEGPAWDAAGERLLLVDIRGHRLHEVAWASGSVTTYEVDETSSAWLPRAGGGTVVVGRRGVRLADVDGRGPLAIEIEADVASNRSNDAKCDPAGRLWVGTMPDAEDAPTGALYRVDPDRSLTRVIEGTTISNGLGWSLDGRRMYFVDSPTKRIDAFAFDPADGEATGRAVFADTSGFAGVPDGLTVDAEGCLWVAMHGGGAVLRFTPEGRHDRTLEVPAAGPTSCCFAGPALDRLVVTTSAGDGGSGGDLLVCDVGVAGTPTVAFAG